MRHIILDTETTGLDAKSGHKIIEVGCLELVNRRVTERYFHHYIDPQRCIDPGAMAVHGITDEFVRGKPIFSGIAQELFDFIKGATLVIHNAPFDLAFLNVEFAMTTLGIKAITDHCEVIDTLVLARKLHPGQKNNLDALCQRYQVKHAHRELHGALLDARLLASVYLAMTSGQSEMFGEMQAQTIAAEKKKHHARPTQNLTQVVLPVSKEEKLAHENFLAAISSDGEAQSQW